MDPNNPMRELGRAAYHNQLVYPTDQAISAIRVLGNSLVLSMSGYMDDLPFEEALAQIEKLREQLAGEADYLIDRKEMLEQRAAKSEGEHAQDQNP